MGEVCEVSDLIDCRVQGNSSLYKTTKYPLWEKNCDHRKTIENARHNDAPIILEMGRQKQGPVFDASLDGIVSSGST